MHVLAKFPLLSLIVWLSILGAFAVISCGTKERCARYLSLGIALLSLFLCLPLMTQFQTHTAAMQFTEEARWIPILGIRYSMGVDGISMPMVVLTCFTTLLIVLASWTMSHVRTAQYLATFLIMQGAVVGVFVSLDAILFYFFWEAILIPMYLNIGIWGMEKRSYAAIKFFLYTFFGSALLLVALLYLRLQSGSFFILDYYSLPLSLSAQIAIFIAFLLAFAIKIPMWPLHTWLPDAHTEAPVGGSVVLAALMLKIGAYGFLRFNLPIVPDACRYLQDLMIILSLVAIVYIGFIAIVQTDMKKLIAYSSVAHMGFVTLGAFMIFLIINHGANQATALLSLEGAMIQMVSHAFGSGAMFLAFGMLYQQMHSRRIKDFGGIAKTMPCFAAFFMLFAMTNVGLPGTSGFVGEFLVLLSAFKANLWINFLAASTLVIGAAYTLWMYKLVFYGPVASQRVAALKDISVSERVIFILVTIAILWLGLYPASLFNVIHDSLQHVLELALHSKLPSGVL